MSGRLADFIARPGSGIIALVGAGGKTSLAYALARELISDGEFVAFTKTTNVTANTFRQDAHLIVEPDAERMRSELRRVRQTEHRLVGLATGYIRADLLQGLSPRDVTGVVNDGAVNRVIVEADGARRRRIKAPSEREPNLPDDTGALVAVVSADAIGRPLNEETAHRSKLVSEIAGLAMGATIGPTHVARLLTSAAGGLKCRPDGARFVCALTWLKDENRPAAFEAMRLVQATGIADAGLLLTQGPDGYLCVEDGWTVEPDWAGA